MERFIWGPYHLKIWKKAENTISIVLSNSIAVVKVIYEWLWCFLGKIGQSSTRSRPLVSYLPFNFLSIVPRAGRKLRSKRLKLRTCTAQEQMKTPGKFILFYFSIWCIIYCYSNSHSNSYKIKDSPPSPRRLGRLWPGCSVLYVNQFRTLQMWTHKNSWCWIKDIWSKVTCMNLFSVKLQELAPVFGHVTHFTPF